MSERLREPQTFPGWSSAPGRGHCEPRPRVGGAGAAGAKALPRGGGGGRGVGRAGGGVREKDPKEIQTSGACGELSGGATEAAPSGFCSGGGCKADARAGAAMVKISFQPAVAGIKGDKADKASASASASASAPAPTPAAEILLTPARVRRAGDLRRPGVRGTEGRPAASGDCPRRIGTPASGAEGRGLGVRHGSSHPEVGRGLGSRHSAVAESVKSEESEGARSLSQAGKSSGSLPKVEGGPRRWSPKRGGGWSEEVRGMLVGGIGVWFQSGTRGRGSSPQVGDGRRVGHCFPQSRVVGCDWWGIKEMGGLVPTKGGGLWISSQTGDCWGGRGEAGGEGRGMYC